MFNDRRKIQLIEDLLKVDNDATLKQVEIVIRKAVTKKKTVTGGAKTTKKSFHDLVGILSKKDAEDMKRIIEEGCEQIDEHGWK